MSQFEKAWEKFNRKPIPKDITLEELRYIVEHFGMSMETGGGKHGIHIRFSKLGIRIPIPIHGNTIGEVYIKQIKEAIGEINSNER